LVTNEAVVRKRFFLTPQPTHHTCSNAAGGSVCLQTANARRLAMVYILYFLILYSNGAGKRKDFRLFSPRTLESLLHLLLTRCKWQEYTQFVTFLQ